MSRLCLGSEEAPTAADNGRSVDRLSGRRAEAPASASYRPEALLPHDHVTAALIAARVFEEVVKKYARTSGIRAIRRGVNAG